MRKPTQLLSSPFLLLYVRKILMAHYQSPGEAPWATDFLQDLGPNAKLLAKIEDSAESSQRENRLLKYIVVPWKAGNCVTSNYTRQVYLSDPSTNATISLISRKSGNCVTSKDPANPLPLTRWRTKNNLHIFTENIILQGSGTRVKASSLGRRAFKSGSRFPCREWWRTASDSWWCDISIFVDFISRLAV